MPQQNSTCRTRRNLTLAAAACALLAAPLGAQSGPCGFFNARNFCVSQDTTNISGEPATGDNFGAVLAFGDFDSDGHQDLVAGVPDEDYAVDLRFNVGAVHVVYGLGFGFTTLGDEYFQQEDVPGGGTSETGDRFGTAFAAGDFDGDGYADLAIGTPRESYPRPAGSNSCGEFSNCDEYGVVQIAHGGPHGLFNDLDTFTIFGFDLDVFEPFFAHEAHLGAALAAGDRDGDGLFELAVGMPGGEYPGGSDHAGLVAFFEGTAEGTFEDRNHLFRDSTPQGDDHLGSTLVFGKFAGARAPYFVAGCPDCDIGGATGTGLVRQESTSFVITEEISQSSLGFSDGDNDALASALAVGDFDGDGSEDLAMGAPGNNLGGNDDSGTVFVAYSSATQGLPHGGFEFWGQSSFGASDEAGARFGAAVAAGDFDGDGFEDLAVGAPRRGSDDRGFVYVLWGSAAGLEVHNPKFISAPSVGGEAQSNGEFGAVLTAADLDGDGVDELAIGVPRYDLGAALQAGTVFVTRALNPHLIFLDGFEIGSSFYWSATAD